MKSFSVPKMLLTAWLIGIVLDISCTSCGQITVKDKEVCGDLGASGAHCAHTLTDAKRDIPKAKWDKERIGYLCMNATGYNDTETSIDQFCQTSNLCSYETQEQIAATEVRLRRVVKKALAARRNSISIPLDSPHSYMPSQGDTDEEDTDQGTSR